MGLLDFFKKRKQKHQSKNIDKTNNLENRHKIDVALSDIAKAVKAHNDQPPSNINAMCYARRLPDIYVDFQCDKCHKSTSLLLTINNRDIIKKYEALAEEFNILGHKATINCFCNKCVSKEFPNITAYTTLWSNTIFPFEKASNVATKNNIVFTFNAKDSNKPVYSFPSIRSYDETLYRIALNFLTHSKVNDKYLDHIQNIIGPINL